MGPARGGLWGDGPRPWELPKGKIRIASMSGGGCPVKKGPEEDSRPEGLTWRLPGCLDGPERGADPEDKLVICGSKS